MLVQPMPDGGGAVFGETCLNTVIIFVLFCLEDDKPYTLPL